MRLVFGALSLVAVVAAKDSYLFVQDNDAELQPTLKEEHDDDEKPVHHGPSGHAPHHKTKHVLPDDHPHKKILLFREKLLLLRRQIINVHRLEDAHADKCFRLEDIARLYRMAAKKLAKVETSLAELQPELVKFKQERIDTSKTELDGEADLKTEESEENAAYNAEEKALNSVIDQKHIVIEKKHLLESFKIDFNNYLRIRLHLLRCFQSAVANHSPFHFVVKLWMKLRFVAKLHCEAAKNFLITKKSLKEEKEKLQQLVEAARNADIFQKQQQREVSVSSGDHIEDERRQGDAEVELFRVQQENFGLEQKHLRIVRLMIDLFTKFGTIKGEAATALEKWQEGYDKAVSMVNDCKHLGGKVSEDLKAPVSCDVEDLPTPPVERPAFELPVHPDQAL